jgi:hypothetical protein
MEVQIEQTDREIDERMNKQICYKIKGAKVHEI